MKTFNGYQYLLIDIANNNPCDGDKLTFEDRIEWANDHMNALEAISTTQQWKEQPLFIKAVQALRNAQAGIPSGHLVGFDAVCSGMQLMSVVTGCIAGAEATGLVNPNKRADAYTTCTDIMSGKLGVTLVNARAKVKQATMTGLYGSKEEPKKEFGDDTPELNAFYEALYEMAPGACQLLQALIESWQPWAKGHAWELPDGYQALVRTKKKIENARIEVDELAHASFSYTYYVNEGARRGVKNAANVIHSLDAYVLRSLVRRCNYDQVHVDNLARDIQVELLERLVEGTQRVPHCLVSREVYQAIKHYERSTVADLAIVPHLGRQHLPRLSTAHLQALASILNQMREHAPFEIITIHDDFKCHPNNMNYLRHHYKEILAELADSEIMSDILNQVHGTTGNQFVKLTPDLSKHIRNSNYALS